MRRVRKSRAGVGMRDDFRPRHVGNVEDEEAVMPVADIETIAHAEWMVATRPRPIFPWIRLAAGLPLARNPPPPDLDRLGRMGQVPNHHDAAHVALRRRRSGGLPAI